MSDEYVYEVIIHDDTAQMLAHLFLPPAGSHVTPDELKRACKRLADATIAWKHSKVGKPQ